MTVIPVDELLLQISAADVQTTTAPTAFEHAKRGLLRRRNSMNRKENGRMPSKTMQPTDKRSQQASLCTLQDGIRDASTRLPVHTTRKACARGGPICYVQFVLLTES